MPSESSVLPCLGPLGTSGRQIQLRASPELFWGLNRVRPSALHLCKERSDGHLFSPGMSLIWAKESQPEPIYYEVTKVA